MPLGIGLDHQQQDVENPCRPSKDTLRECQSVALEAWARGWSSPSGSIASAIRGGAARNHPKPGDSRPMAPTFQGAPSGRVGASCRIWTAHTCSFPPLIAPSTGPVLKSVAEKWMPRWSAREYAAESAEMLPAAKMTPTCKSRRRVRRLDDQPVNASWNPPKSRRSTSPSSSKSNAARQAAAHCGSDGVGACSGPPMHSTRA